MFHIAPQVIETLCRYHSPVLPSFLGCGPDEVSYPEQRASNNEIDHCCEDVWENDIWIDGCHGRWNLDPDKIHLAERKVHWPNAYSANNQKQNETNVHNSPSKNFGTKLSRHKSLFQKISGGNPIRLNLIGCSALCEYLSNSHEPCFQDGLTDDVYSTFFSVRISMKASEQNNLFRHRPLDSGSPVSSKVAEVFPEETVNPGESGFNTFGLEFEHQTDCSNSGAAKTTIRLPFELTNFNRFCVQVAPPFLTFSVAR